MDSQKEKLKQQQQSSPTTKATTQPVASPRTMVATAVASPRTSAVPPPVAAPRTTASNVRQSSLEMAPSEAFETKVLRSQELESAFAGEPFSAVEYVHSAHILNATRLVVCSLPGLI